MICGYHYCVRCGCHCCVCDVVATIVCVMWLPLLCEMCHFFLMRFDDTPLKYFFYKLSVYIVIITEVA